MPVSKYTSSWARGVLFAHGMREFEDDRASRMPWPLRMLAASLGRNRGLHPRARAR